MARRRMRCLLVGEGPKAAFSALRGWLLRRQSSFLPATRSSEPQGSESRGEFDGPAECACCVSLSRQFITEGTSDDYETKQPE